MAVVAFLVVANAARSLAIPHGARIWFTIGAALTLVALSAGFGLGADELGLAPGTLRRGAVFGGSAFALITLVIVGAALIAPGAGVFDDDRTDVGVADMLRTVLVVIPVGTVVVEELAFRGVLHAVLLRYTDGVRAMATGAVVFGAWHILPVLTATSRGLSSGRVGTAALTFVATSLAGLGFSWLRHRSGSLLAPIAAHLATNSIAFAAAWAVNR